MMELEEKRVQMKQSVVLITNKGHNFIANGKLDKALDLFMKAYALAKKTQDNSFERTCALNLGAAYIEAGKPSEGLKSLEKLPYLEREHTYNGDLYNNYAEAYRALGEVNKAVKYYLKAFDEFKSNQDAHLKSKEIIDCLEKCIQLCIMRNDHSKVVGVYKRMIDVYEAQGNRVKQASCLCNLASTQKQAGDNDAAFKSVSDAAEILQKIVDAEEEEPSEETDVAVVGTIFNDLGLVYSQLLHYDEASGWFERALRWVQTSSKNKHHEAVVLQNMGAVCSFQGQYQFAVDYFEQAAEIYARLKNRVSQGHCFYNMAFAYIELGRAEEADVAFNHALQAAKDCGDITTRRQALEGLGDNKFNQTNYEKAQEFYFDALAAVPVTKTDVRERVKKKVQGSIKETTVRGGMSSREARQNQRMASNRPLISPRSTYPPSDTVALRNQFVEAVKEKEENEDQTLRPGDSSNMDRNKQEEFEEQEAETDGTSEDEDDRTPEQNDYGQGPSTSESLGKAKMKKKTSFAPDTLGKKCHPTSRKSSRR